MPARRSRGQAPGGIYDFRLLRQRQVVDGRPSPAMTGRGQRTSIISRGILNARGNPCSAECAKARITTETRRHGAERSSAGLDILLRVAVIPGARNDDSSIISGAWYRAPGWRAAARRTKTHANGHSLWPVV